MELSPFIIFYWLGCCVVSRAHDWRRGFLIIFGETTLWQLKLLDSDIHWSLFDTRLFIGFAWHRITVCNQIISDFHFSFLLDEVNCFIHNAVYSYLLLIEISFPFVFLKNHWFLERLINLLRKYTHCNWGPVLRCIAWWYSQGLTDKRIFRQIIWNKFFDFIEVQHCSVHILPWIMINYLNRRFLR